MKKNKKLHKANQQMRCPYCGSPVIFRGADDIYRENSQGSMLYVCSRYPECDSYVRAAHGEPRQPRVTHPAPHGPLLFRPALQIRAHEPGDAYRWLADKMRTPLVDAHIGNLREYYCRQVIEESRRVLGAEVKEKMERRGAS